MCKGHILLVDDDPRILKGLRETLEDEEYTVTTASNGKEGWEKCQAFPYDLVITDWRMPGMTGLELVIEINKKFENLRVIILTAYGSEFEEKLEEQHLRADYSRKPVSVANLLKKVAGALEGRRLRFVLGQLVPMVEDRLHEFKEVKGQGPVNTIKNTADEYAVAFLNAEGGSIYWGIKDNGEVGGVQLAVGQRDEIRRVVNEKLAQIQPTVAVSSFRVECHPVYTEQGAEIAETCVVEVVVPPGSPKVLYFTGSNEAFVKVDGARRKLNGPQIQAEIQKRLEL